MLSFVLSGCFTSSLHLFQFPLRWPADRASAARRGNGYCQRVSLSAAPRALMVRRSSGESWGEPSLTYTDCSTLAGHWTRLKPVAYFTTYTHLGTRQSTGAVRKSRWASWAPVPNKPTVSVDVKQHFKSVRPSEKSVPQVNAVHTKLPQKAFLLRGLCERSFRSILCGLYTVHTPSAAGAAGAEIKAP